MRKFLLLILVGLVGLLFLGRLFYLQVLNPSFAALAHRNAVEMKFIYPQRGFIYDRNGKLLVSNQPTYDLMVIPRKVEAFDTLMLTKLVHITPKQLRHQLKKAKIYSSRLPSIVVGDISKENYAYLQEKTRNFPGFYVQKRYMRDYHVHGAANVLGYLSQVNGAEVRSIDYYEPGDLIGRSGVEKQYEKLLRGEKGVKFLQKDRFNITIGSYKNGKYDTLPVQGKNLTLTLDMELQAYGEKLMQHKRGAIVAIEPSTGEILCLVSAPSYDPGLLVGRERSENFNRLWYDTIRKPLFDRALLSQFSPGSTFKVVQAALALEEQVITPHTGISCHRGFYYGRSAHMACEAHPSPLSVEGAVAYSCNTFFAKAYWRMIDKYDTPQQGMNVWHDNLVKFGFDDYLGYDLPVGRPGFIPDASYYNRVYNYPKYHWAASYTLSNGIGQGEVLVTPIQLANMVTAIANRGWFYTPHILKKVEGKPIKNKKYTTKHYTGVDEKYFEPVIEGMRQVYEYGTGRFSRVPGVVTCGKTGTAENFSVVNGKRKELESHSLFVAFAPMKKPKIAISVFVANGEWGSKYSAKIAGLMMAKYLKGKVERKDNEQWILTHGLEEVYAEAYGYELDSLKSDYQ